MRRPLLLALAIFATAAAPAAADQVPTGCVTSDLQLVITPNTAVRPNDPVKFTVTASNASQGACKITNATVKLRLPSASGSATGEVKTLTTDATFAAGTSGTIVGGASVPYTVAVDPGVTALAVRADATFTAHTGAVDETDTATGKLSVAVTQPWLTLSATPSLSSGLVPLTSTVSYVLRNTSTTPAGLTNPTLADGGCSAPARTGGDTDGDNVLDNGEGWTYTCQFSLTRPTEVHATVVASAFNPVDQRPVTAPNASWTVTGTAPPRPRITLTKTADPASGVAPFITEYTYVVTNESEPDAKPVANIAIDDSGCSPAIAVSPDPSLARGEQVTFKCSNVLASAGSITAAAIATGQDEYDGTTISSNQATTTVSGSLTPVVIPAPEPSATPAPTATPTPGGPGFAPDGTPIQQPASKPSTRVKFAYTGRFSPARSCRGTVTLTLTAGKKKVATKKVKLDSKCRFKVSFDVARTRLAKATKVTVTAKATGKKTATKRLTVPKR